LENKGQRFRESVKTLRGNTFYIFITRRNNPSKQKWAILFGSRYGRTRDASLWIVEGRGWVADIFDARENPDLTSYDGIIVGSGIYYSKIDQPLGAYLIKNVHAISGKAKALFAV
jgi:menaquinone-dependent protoporphyrinogen IX oxidase